MTYLVQPTLPFYCPGITPVPDNCSLPFQILTTADYLIDHSCSGDFALTWRLYVSLYAIRDAIVSRNPRWNSITFQISDTLPDRQFNGETFPNVWNGYTNEVVSANYIIIGTRVRSTRWPIMFCYCLFFFYIFFFYSPFVLRNYSTDSHQIFRNCVFWCSLNNPIVLKFFWRHLAEKIAKNSKNLVKISWVDSDFWQ